MNGSEPEINGNVSLWRAIWGFAKLQDEMFYSRLHFVFMQTGEEVYIGRSLSLKVDLSRWWSLRSHFPFSLATKLKRANEKKSKKLLRQQSMKKIETDIHSVWQKFSESSVSALPALSKEKSIFQVFLFCGNRFGFGREGASNERFLWHFNHWFGSIVRWLCNKEALSKTSVEWWATIAKHPRSGSTPHRLFPSQFPKRFVGFGLS